MKSQTLAVLAGAALSCAPYPIVHAAESDLATVRAEIDQLRRAYESRIAALEDKLAKAEVKADAAQESARQANIVASQKPVAESAFNPAISAVLVGNYTSLSQDPGSYTIGGFIPPGGEIAPPRRSFSLGESEITMSANVDHLLRGQLTVALPPDEGGAEVEEAFIQTLGLGGGTSLKAGRFLSDIGYLNGQHAHAWDFADAPLAYKSFLGGQLRNDGVQLRWLAPTAHYLEFGAEAASGGPFPSVDRNKNGSTLGTAFARLGGDVGSAHSWRVGLSYLATSPRDRSYEDTDSLGTAVTNTVSGRSNLWILEGIWKWTPDAGDRSLVLQGEYFRRREKGDLGFDVAGANLSGDYRSRQSGFYAQAVYQFMPRWRAGYRFDRLDSGSSDIGLVENGSLSAADFPALAAYKPRRDSVMVDWSASEFSRVRLQLARDRSRPDAVDNQVWLQYIVNLGAHGAHGY